MTGDDPAVGQIPGKLAGLKTPLLGDDAAEAVKRLLDHVLDEFLLLLRGWAGGIEEILEGAAFERKSGNTDDLGKTLKV